MKQWLYLASDLHQKGSEYRHQRDDAQSYDSCWIMKFKPEARCCRFWAWFSANITNILSTLFTANCSSSPLCLYMLWGGCTQNILSDSIIKDVQKFFEKAILRCSAGIWHLPVFVSEESIFCELIELFCRFLLSSLLMLRELFYSVNEQYSSDPDFEWSVSTTVSDSFSFMEETLQHRVNTEQLCIMRLNSSS